MIHCKNPPKFNDNSYVHFTTTNTYRKLSYFRNEEFCRILLEELEFYHERYGFSMIGYVIMPDHLHLLLWWDIREKPELNISKIMQVIKGVTARRVVDLMTAVRLEQMLQPTLRKGEQKSSQSEKNAQAHRQNLRHRLWQPGFHDFNIYSEDKLVEKLNYIHHNPVEAGIVSSPGEYKWSSYKRYFSEVEGFLEAGAPELFDD